MEIPELYFDRKKEFRHMTLVGLAYFLLIVLDIFAVRGVARILTELTGTGWMNNDWSYYAVCLLPSYLICMPACFILLYFARADAPAKKPLSAKFLLGAAAVCITGVEAGSYLGTLSTDFLSSVLGWELEDTVSELISSSNLLPTVLFACILAPVFEELFFRKLLIDRLRHYGELPAMIISAVGFGLYHGNFYQFFYAALIGAVLAYVYLKSGKLIYSVVFHMIINLMGSVIPYAINEMSGGVLYAENMFENIPALIASLAYGGFLILVAVAGVIVLLVNRKNIRFEKGEAAFRRNDAMFVYLVNPGVILFLLCTAYYFLRSLSA